MGFTYTPSATPDDVTLVRYHIGDTDAEAAIFSDEEIGMVLAMELSVGAAVVSLIKTIISKLAMEPDTTADWLTISWRRSSDAWLKLLAEKKRDFGMGFTMTTTSTDIYRKDSQQGGAGYVPNYRDGRGIPDDWRD